MVMHFKKIGTMEMISRIRKTISLIEIDVQDNNLSSFQKLWAELHCHNQALLEVGMIEIKDDIEGK